MDHRRAGHIVFAGLSPRTLPSLWNRGVLYRVLDVDLLSRNGFECLVAPCPPALVFEIDSYFGWLATPILSLLLNRLRYQYLTFTFIPFIRLAARFGDWHFG